MKTTVMKYRNYIPYPLISRQDEQALPVMSKRAVADAILDRVNEL